MPAVVFGMRRSDRKRHRRAGLVGMEERGDQLERGPGIIERDRKGLSGGDRLVKELVLAREPGLTGGNLRHHDLDGAPDLRRFRNHCPWLVAGSGGVFVPSLPLEGYILE